ncbi:MAG: YihY/virulence factor BrkB family protein [bacterium]|nr:YihY/virulence factor BrkB family protein [bacterium]
MPEQASPNPDNAPEPSSNIEKQVRDWRAEFERIYTVTKIGIIGLYKSQLPRMAAALAFRTIFSIIPVMAIGLLIFGSIVSEDQVESGVRRVLDFAGVSQISTIDPAAPDSQLVTGELSPDEVMETIEDAAEQETGASDPEQPSDPFAGTDLEEVITDLINRVNTSIRNVPTGWIALTSGLVLLYAAMSMLIEIEKSFNQLCGAPGGRPWLRRLMLYWTILTAGSLMLAATFLAGDAFTQWVVSIAGQDSIVGAVMAGYGVSVLISTILLLGAYTTIPNTRIKFRTALAGAFFAAVLWELGKLGFTTYLRYTTTYSKFYGSIAILPLFLLWIYLTWLIVLFGVQASYALQNFQRLVQSKLNPSSGGDDSSLPLMDPLVALSVARAIQDGFESGKPVTADQVAEMTDLRSAQATEVITVLHRGGFIHKVEEGDRDPAWTPARPADQIPLDEILRSAQSLDAFRVSRADDLLPESILDAAIGSCKGKSIADLRPQNPGENVPS